MRLAILLLAVTGTSAQATVVSATPAGFETRSEVVVPAAPADTWFVLGQIGQWWSSEHSDSGNASNLSLTTRAGGCLCEIVPSTGASIEHGHVIYAQPNVMLRLQTALGPLQAEAVTGTLTWELKEVPGGTRVVQTYIVGGYARAGLQKLAPVVDKVLTEQLAGLKKRLVDGHPPASPTGR
jgi:uncharacterized protein YndB with AHSA1/START domain